MTDSSQADNNADLQETPGKLLPLPDIGDLLFLGILYILLAGRPDYLYQDASVGWHLVAGQWIWEHHAVPQTDLFSYTFADKPWIAYEWLFELGAYALTTIGGLNLLSVVTSSLIAFVLIKCYDRARSAGTPLMMALLISGLAIFASAIHWLARPHIISFLGVYVYTSTLDDYYHSKIGRTRLFVTLVAMMVLWVNCHPAFFFGLALIGLYMVCAFVTSRISNDAEERRLRMTQAINYAAILAVTGAVTFLNPYGIRLHEYIFGYLTGTSAILAETDEFKSPVFHDNIHAFCLEALIILMIAGFAITRKRVSLPTTSTFITMLHLSLSAVRSIPFFSIVSLPFIGSLYSTTRFDERLQAYKAGGGDKPGPIRRFYQIVSDFGKQEQYCKMRIIPIATFLILSTTAICGGKFLGITLATGFSNEKMPTATLDYIRDKKLPVDRGFNLDNWGGLIRYKLNQRVFIDDRADFFGEQFYQQYGKVVRTQPGFEDILNKHNIAWILMPKNSLLGRALKSNPEWEIACEDPAAYLLTRKESVEPPHVDNK